MLNTPFKTELGQHVLVHINFKKTKNFIITKLKMDMEQRSADTK